MTQTAFKYPTISNYSNSWRGIRKLFFAFRFYNTTFNKQESPHVGTKVYLSYDYKVIKNTTTNRVV